MDHILLTGATGLVGRYLLRDLLSAGEPVAVLTRSRRMQPAHARVDSALAALERQDGRKYPRPTVIDGDVRSPGCGIAAHDRHWIAANCSRVLHSAASMMFREDKQGEPHRTNVEGMRNLLELCRDCGLRQFHHVSTAYICGLRNGRIFEHEIDLGQKNGNVYEVSKLAAEKLVRGAEFLEQLTVYRPASVVGDSQTGYTTSSHGFYLPLQLAYALADRVPAELMGPSLLTLLGLNGEEGKNVVPVDWLSRAIVHLVRRPEHHGRTYHLTHPQPVTVRLVQQVIREAIATHCGDRLAAAPSEEEIEQYQSQFKDYMEVYRSHWRDDPIFDRSNAEPALRDVPCPEMTHERMLRIAAYPVQRKFILGDVLAPAAVPKAPTSTVSIEPTAELLPAEPETDYNEPIAVIGMACRLPGAANLDEYWRLLESGGSAVREAPPDRFNARQYFDPKKGVRGKAYSKLAALLADRNFNRDSCPISPELERSVDNAHLLMCEVAAAACRHAGLDPFNLPLRNTGVYIGHAQGSDLSGDLTFTDCIEEAAEQIKQIPAIAALGEPQQQALVDELVAAACEGMPVRTADSPDPSISLVAGTIAKAFGLTGPYISLNAACASSLQAVQFAARALQAGRIEMAIVGGASDCKTGSMVLFSNAQTLSAKGSCPFDDDADGLIISEGYVAVVLKTLRRALADGDPIQAIIPAFGCSSDGKGKSLWAPRKEGQVAAMQRAYAGGLDMGSIQFVEAHATSTSLGDATELSALSEVLAGKTRPGRKVAVTSVKANIGHSLEAAGVAGLIKTVLCLQHRTIVQAINIHKLNSKINWAAAPIFVPLRNESWPEQPDGAPRRAAVNAFGIGGLNMHVVVEEYTPARRAELFARYKRPSKSAGQIRGEDDAIAVIGGGCILPGATGLDQFWELLKSGRDPKGPTPAGRWRSDLALKPRAGRGGDGRPLPTTLGGYITDFAYDWKKHKVPPIQVQQADPLQFMLLEAAEQAVRDAGYGEKEFDRSRVAVLVGTESGGDFGTQLCVSLRLPELEEIIQRLLARRGFATEQSAKVAAEFSQRLLKAWPALIDESGSFSTSTLASRITKTLNLMGGASAIDVGGASSAAALAIAVDLLLAGDCDMLICAGGQRCMNLPKYRSLHLTGALAKSDRPASPFDAAAEGVVPGEGVGVVLLKRLSDARRDGDRVRAIIRGVGLAHGGDGQQGAAWRLAVERALARAKISGADISLVEADGAGLAHEDEPHALAIAAALDGPQRREPAVLAGVAGQIGHTVGASAMASLLAAMIEVDRGEAPRQFGVSRPIGAVQQHERALRVASEPAKLSCTADGRRFAAVDSYCKGLAAEIIIERGERVASTEDPSLTSQDETEHQMVAEAERQPAAATPSITSEPVILRIGLAAAHELGAKLQTLLADPSAAFRSGMSSRFTLTDGARAAIVASSPAQLAERLKALHAQCGAAGPTAGSALDALQRQGCVYRARPGKPPRVALLLPGQGSQYAGMLRDLITQSPAAAAMRDRLDEIFARHGYSSFADMAWDRPEQLGVDIWLTQLATLSADLIVYSAVEDAGIRADLVAGHSLGEYAALAAAGAWSLEGVVLALRARYEAIRATTRGQTRLMAVAAAAESIEPVLKSARQAAYIANINAPDQTIIGGASAALEEIAAALKSRGMASQMLGVPCAYHTPLLAEAGQALARSLEALVVRPPRIPLLSSVTNCFVAEPAEIRGNLAEQLTTPVRYVELIERIVTDEPTVLVEVGPGRTLSGLNQKILRARNGASQATEIIACDNPKAPGIEPLLVARALLECLGAIGAEQTTPAAHVAPAIRRSSMPVAAREKSPVIHVDATEKRRERMRRASSSSGNGHAEHAPPARVPSGAEPNGHSTQRFSPQSAGAARPAVAKQTDAGVMHSGNGQSSTPKPAPPPPAPVAQAKTPRHDRQDLEKFLIAFVIEHTGYPPEAVDLDLDLEADLGIDSIKKAQLFAELGEYFDVRPKEGTTLDAFPTLRHVLDYLAEATDAGAVPSGENEPVGNMPSLVADPSPTIPLKGRYPDRGNLVSVAPTSQTAAAVTIAEPEPAPSGTGLEAAELEKFLINFVVEQTGYPPEAVDLDSDLEADLGIDSIKKAQLFAELSEYFDARPAEGMTLDDFPTLRHALNFLVAADPKKKAPGDPEPAPVTQTGQTGAEAEARVAPAPQVAPEPPSVVPEVALAGLQPSPDAVTERYEMRMNRAPLPASIPDLPQCAGAALVVGQHAVAAAIIERLTAGGIAVQQIETLAPLESAIAELERLWREQPITHVLLTEDWGLPPLAVDDVDAWRRRRYLSADAPLLFAQRWVQLAGDADLLDKVTIAAVTDSGGDFGFGGGALNSPTGAALAALMKAIYIEIGFLRRLKNLRAKAIDFPVGEPAERVAACVLRELAGGSVDFEIGYVAGERYLPCAYPRSAADPNLSAIHSGGVWVVTGGASGITAECALELARRFHLRLHLIGRSPRPEVDPAWRDLAGDSLKALKTQIMREARAAGRNMDEAWLRVERNLEIDRRLRQFTAGGIDFTYHACDVADAAQLGRVLAHIRSTSGPISGVLHGAGIERACRFEKKQAEHVRATLDSKVDGAMNLMRLTWNDPLTHFITFGSISGRMGSNGQADYCVASDTVCRLAAWLQARRPEVHATGFHWHSWAEVGMAAKEENIRAMKSTDGPELMPKAEGVGHFLRELLSDQRQPEVLITTPEYCRRYYKPEDAAKAAVDSSESREWPPQSVKLVAARHRLTMTPASLGDETMRGAGAAGTAWLRGPVWILGDNRAASALRDRLASAGAIVRQFSTGQAVDSTLSAIEAVFKHEPPRHVFLMTSRADQPLDMAAMTADGWRRFKAERVMTPLLAVRRLLQLRRQARNHEPLTITAVTSLGGDFGLSYPRPSPRRPSPLTATSLDVPAPDGGVMTGLLKSLYIEDSRLAESEGRFKVIDAPADEPFDQLFDAICRELSADDPRIEVAWSRGVRSIPTATEQPIESLPRKQAAASGVWIVTGGARGITAASAEALARRYGIKLRIIGRSPAPVADAPWRGADEQKLAEIKSQMVREALAAGRSIERDWERMRSDIEIHETLERLKASSIDAKYFSCDLANWEQLAEILETVRREDGPIEGVLHGAGYGKSGRFDTRPLDSIERTLDGKLDGAVALMALTARDPLKCWIGYGSLSGRFGGNGLGDYAAGNDMLAKLIDGLAAWRPDCRACCFHWQSWNEIGMAMLGDSAAGTKNILKMEFLSPEEGLEHLCREIEAGLPASEVLITDGFFERTFYPERGEGRGAAGRGSAPQWPLVAAHRAADGGVVAQLDFQPQADPFLLDHRLNGRPLLPAVIGMEAMVEAATLAAGRPIAELRDVEFVSGLRFSGDRPIVSRLVVTSLEPSAAGHTAQASRLTTQDSSLTPHPDAGQFECRLVSDVANRSGAILQSDRLHMRGLAGVGVSATPAPSLTVPPGADWKPFKYPAEGPLIHGPSLHALKAGTMEGEMAWGQLVALPLSALGGAGRGPDWLTPAVVIDAGFYLCGVYVWLAVEAVVSLPAGIGAVRYVRMPRDNEPCIAQSRFLGRDGRYAEFDLTVFGEDRAPIVIVERFRCQLLGGGA